MENREKLLSALADKDPVGELRKIAIGLSRSGLGKQAIYDIFYGLHKDLQDSGRTREEDILGDVMDMIMDTYAGKNLNLPK